MLRDLKHSLRMFAQSPAFAIAAISALTLGIGVNTAIFSVVNAVLLKPVPFPDPDRLILFMNTSPQGANPSASPAKFVHWRQQTSVVQDAAAFRFGVVNYTGGSFPEQLRSGQVSADFFALFGAPVVLGRTFSADEDLPQGPRVVVLSALRRGHLGSSRIHSHSRRPDDGGVDRRVAPGATRQSGGSARGAPDRYLGKARERRFRVTPARDCIGMQRDEEPQRSGKRFVELSRVISA